MPVAITEWAGAQNFTEIEAIQDLTIGLLNNETIDALADVMASDVAKGAVGRGTISTDASTDFWILYGCQISGTNPGSRTVTAGAILYQNQVYHVSAKTVTTSGAQVVYWQVKTIDLHETKELEIIAGTSGGGIKDEGDTSIYRFGEWVESNTPSAGLSLSFTSNTAVSYNTDVYNYQYRRVGNTLEINFLVTATIVTGATSVTEIFIPLPDGFTKKDPTSANFCKYGVGRYDMPTSTTAYLNMLVKDYDDGLEGNKIVMLRNTNAEALGATIILDTAGSLTLRGSITLEIE